MLIKAIPDKEGAVNRGLLCGKGIFGFNCARLEGRLLEPLALREQGLAETDYHEAFVLTAKKLQSTAAKYGKSAVAVAISDRYTNEEAYVIKKFADQIGAGTFCFNHRQNGLAGVLGFDASPNTIDELLATEVILAAGFDAEQNPVLRIKLKQAAEAGARVILINPEGYEQPRFEFAEKALSVKNDLGFLKEVARALLDMGKKTAAAGFDEFAASLGDVKVSAEAKAVAGLYGNAKKAMLVFQQNMVTTEAAALLGSIAVVSGHIGAPRDGILMVKAKNNSQGLVDLGIRAGAEALVGVKALLIFGEDPKADLSGLEFLMVSDTHLTETAKKADVVIPGSGFASAEGTYTNTERRLQPVRQAVGEDVYFSNWEIAAELAHVFEVEMPFDDTCDVSLEMDEALCKYRDAELGQVSGGALVPEKAVLGAAKDAKFVDPLDSTDQLMNVIAEKLPKPA
jgi:formate dehydrogenase major subunit